MFRAAFRSEFDVMEVETHCALMMRDQRSLKGHKGNVNRTWSAPLHLLGGQPLPHSNWARFRFMLLQSSLEFSWPSSKI